MGNPRPRPDHLSRKLRQIRLALRLSQAQMLTRLGLEEEMKASRISQYETNDREPSLDTLLAYTYAAGIHLEYIVDDDLELPDKIPGPVHKLPPKKTRRKPATKGTKSIKGVS